MDLFVVNRYDGDSGPAPAGQEDREAKILARLNARKKKRVEQVEKPCQKDEVGQESVVDKPEEVQPLNVEELLEAQPGETVKAVSEEVPHVEEVPDEEVEEEIGAGFTVLEEVGKAGKEKAHRVLPGWLSKPYVVSRALASDRIPIKDLPGIEGSVQDTLRRNRIKHFFPVQRQVIPFLLKTSDSLYRPSDICVSAPTGSGKTLAFVLPIVQALNRHSVRKLRCLVVLPIHDLAVQVHSIFTTYCSGTRLNAVLVSASTSFSEEQKCLVRLDAQGERFLSLADIVVCTPGRLVDHMQRTPGLCLDSLRYLVIDEADRIMDESHNDWLYHLERSMSRAGGAAAATPAVSLVAQSLSRPPRHWFQKLLFSATLSQDPQKLSTLNLFQPRLFTSVVSQDTPTAPAAGHAHPGGGEQHHFTGKYTTPAELTENYVLAAASLKPLAVFELLTKHQFRPALCFAASTAACHRLALLLRHLGAARGISVAECSSLVGRQHRARTIANFSNNKIDIMVCTDAVARGMDLGVVDCVVSYDPPKFAKNYIHRIGRTARAGRPGNAITILTEQEVSRFQRMISSADKKKVEPLEMTTDDLAVHEAAFRAALESLKESVDEEKQLETAQHQRARHQKRPHNHKPQSTGPDHKGVKRNNHPKTFAGKKNGGAGAKNRHNFKKNGRNFKKPASAK